MANGGGAPPPLPPGGGGPGGLPAADAAAGAAPGAPGAPPVLPCKWELFVKVHSQEKFWPKKQFDVELHNMNGANLGAVAEKQSLTMVAKDSPDTHFKGSGAKTFGVTATVGDIATEAKWILTAGRTNKNPLPGNFQQVSVRNSQMGARAQHINLYARHPLFVYLQLKFKDPEDRLLTFPKDFPVRVYAGGVRGSEFTRVKADEDGKIHFEMDRRHEWFTLKFGDGSKSFISNADGTGTTTKWKPWSDLGNLHTQNAKFFSPPRSWYMLESDWKFMAGQEPKYIDDSPAYKEDEAKIYIYKDAIKNWVRRIGEDNAYVELTLDPHWQFVRFEHFDRYFGHSDHGHNRVNTPNHLIDLYWRETASKTNREGSSHWTLLPKDTDASVHCLPWIRQKDAAGVTSEKPDKKALIMFETAVNTFACSQDAQTRLVEHVKSNDARLKSSADRLKLYDMPAVWKSKGYFARYKNGPDDYPGKFFEDWDNPGILKSRAKATPMIFSLDDIIMTDARQVPLNLTVNDRFAFFYHRFKSAYNEAGNVSNEGVYKPDTANKEPFYSKVTLKGIKNNYLTEYPNWVRLAAGLAGLFDVFDLRTKSGVWGARAAVRWYDPVTSGTPAGNVVGWPGVIEKGHFVINPYFGQKHHETWTQYANANSASFRIGRFDMALMRCCDRDGTKEVFLNMQYFRLMYNFLATSALAGNVGGQKTFIKDSSSNLVARWNGNDVANATRTELLPQNNASEHQGEVIFFIQPSADAKGAHFRVDVGALAPPRAWMNSTNGTGVADDTFFKPEIQFAQNSFTSAHELGHGASMPDEYGEWWNNCSHNSPAVSCNIPADPFVDEGRDFDLTNTLHAGENPGAPAANPAPYPMMTMAVEMRNRYFWHNAEFARKYAKEAFLVKHGAYAEYKVPGHPGYPYRNYTYWPAKSAIAKTMGKHGRIDAYLHVAGKEKFTVDLVPKGPYDGIVSILLRIDFTTAATVNPSFARNLIRNAMLDLNGKYFAKGDAKVVTDAGTKTVTMNKCMLRLSPRFLISNVDATASNAATYAPDYNALRGTFGNQLIVKVEDNTGKAPAMRVAAAWAGATSRTLRLVVDTASPTAKADFTADVLQFFPEMLGLAKGAAIGAADFKPIIELVMNKNGDTGNL